MKSIRTDKARPGDLIAGTGASGDYEGGPRRLADIVRAPREEKRTDGTKAYEVEWADGSKQVYYGDTALLLQQRP